LDVDRRAGSPWPVANETVIQIVGYAGAAAAVAGAITAFARHSDLSEGASLAIILGVAAVLLAAGIAIGEREHDAYRLMRSVLWFAAAESFGFAAGIFWSSTLDLGPKTAAVLTGLITAAFALALWVMLRRSLQQIAFFVAAVGTITAVTFPSGLSSTSDLNGPLLVVWVCAMAWFAAGTAGVVRPPRTARVLGAVVAIIATIEMFAASFGLALTLVSVTSLVLLAVGDQIDDRAIVGLGIVAVLLASSVGVGRAAIDSEATGVVAIVVGLLLLAGAIAAIRKSGPLDVPPLAAGVEPPMPPPPAAH
jgi:hypothetical protein